MSKLYRIVVLYDPFERYDKYEINIDYFKQLLNEYIKFCKVVKPNDLILTRSGHVFSMKPVWYEKVSNNEIKARTINTSKVFKLLQKNHYSLHDQSDSFDPLNILLEVLENIEANVIANPFDDPKIKLTDKTESSWIIKVDDKTLAMGVEKFIACKEYEYNIDKETFRKIFYIYQKYKHKFNLSDLDPDEIKLQRTGNQFSIEPIWYDKLNKTKN